MNKLKKENDWYKIFIKTLCILYRMIGRNCISFPGNIDTIRTISISTWLIFFFILTKQCCFAMNNKKTKHHPENDLSHLVFTESEYFLFFNILKHKSFFNRLMEFFFFIIKEK